MKKNGYQNFGGQGISCYCERSEGTEAVLAEWKEAHSACICGKCQQRIKSLKMVAQTSDIKTNFLIFMF